MTTTNSKFAVTYTIDYTHRVVVGVTAPNAEAAILIASDAFDEGEIWEDTEQMPLFFDDFEEVAGETLVYSAEQVTEFPEPDASVKAIKQKEFAFKACQALLAGQVDEARDFAMKAMPHIADSLKTKANSLVFQTEDSCLRSTEVIKLAKDHNLKLSLYSAGIRFMHYLTSIPGGQYLHATMDGITRKINPEDFLDTYPDSLGKIWCLHAREIAMNPILNVPEALSSEQDDDDRHKESTWKVTSDNGCDSFEVTASDLNDARRDALQAIGWDVLPIPSDALLTSSEVLELAKENDMELSLSLKGRVSSTHFLSSVHDGDKYSYQETTGIDNVIYEITSEDFLDTYPDSLGKIWRLHAREIAMKPMSNVPDNKTNWEVIDQSQYLLELYNQ